MIDPKIEKAVREPGNHLLVVVRKKYEPPVASESVQSSRFEGLGYIDSPAMGNNGEAVFVRSYHWPKKMGVYWLDGEVFIPAGRIE